MKRERPERVTAGDLARLERDPLEVLEPATPARRERLLRAWKAVEPSLRGLRALSERVVRLSGMAHRTYVRLLEREWDRPRDSGSAGGRASAETKRARTEARRECVRAEIGDTPPGDVPPERRRTIARKLGVSTRTVERDLAAIARNRDT